MINYKNIMSYYTITNARCVLEPAFDEGSAKKVWCNLSPNYLILKVGQRTLDDVTRGSSLKQNSYTSEFYRTHWKEKEDYLNFIPIQLDNA